MREPLRRVLVRLRFGRRGMRLGLVIISVHVDHFPVVRAYSAAHSGPGLAVGVSSRSEGRVWQGFVGPGWSSRRGVRMEPGGRAVCL
jgi:hypothetical protein